MNYSEAKKACFALVYVSVTIDPLLSDIVRCQEQPDQVSAQLTIFGGKVGKMEKSWNQCTKHLAKVTVKGRVVADLIIFIWNAKA